MSPSGAFAKDEIGNRYTRLVILSRVENSKAQKARWLCRCDCGNLVFVTTGNLHSGEVRSCGCLRGLQEGEAAMNQLISRIKTAGIKRGYEWKLERRQAKKLFKQPCYYCGLEPAQIAHDKGMKGSFIYNGLDRVDNTKGYAPDNVVPCCKHCNSAKRCMTITEFEGWVRRIHAHFIVGK